ncbi:MAG: winged helix-turn-helix domain-containing protein [Treponemataceae bacterium]|nr:winged helix-turn-helix domain-containing protein [Treponemataceae bacterium]
MDDLISLITQAEMISIPELCDKLNMSKDMLLARLERYEQLGYIKRIVEKGASSGCSCNCNSCKGCHTSVGGVTPSVYWTKGDHLK